MSDTNEPVGGLPDGFMRFRLDCSYEGTAFNGWAVQPDMRTVQATIEWALATLCRTPIRLTVAGRTDAGVHAIGQVAHFDCSPAVLAQLRARSHAQIPDLATTILVRLRSLLHRAPDITINGCTLAPTGFDARFSATWRSYRYRVWMGEGLSPLERRYTLQIPESVLDLDEMNQVSRELVGLRDWAGFCRPRPFATTVRELQQFLWERHGQEVIAQLRADAFCYHMVRCLVGALLQVGRGELDRDDIFALLERGRRDNEYPLVPSSGLVLEQVAYPADDELFHRAELTRSKRQLTSSEPTPRPSRSSSGTPGSGPLA